MSDYLTFRAGLVGKSDRVDGNEEHLVREGKEEKKQISKEKREEVIKDFESDFNVKEMP